MFLPVRDENNDVLFAVAFMVLEMQQFDATFSPQTVHDCDDFSMPPRPCLHRQSKAAGLR